jgi:hypothetical protein
MKRILPVALAMVVLMVVLAGCAAPSAQQPGEPHQGSVSATDQVAVMRALDAAKVTYPASGLRMVYDKDKQHITVSGDMSTQPASGSAQPLSVLEMEYKDGSWAPVMKAGPQQ